jgi:hypothetical protein
MARLFHPIGLLVLLTSNAVSAVNIGEEIPATAHRYTDSRFNLDDLDVKLISADQIEVKVTMSAAAAECAGISEQNSPWMHLTFYGDGNRRYDVTDVMLVRAPDRSGYYHHHATVNVRELQDEMPNIRSVSAWMGGSQCNP